MPFKKLFNKNYQHYFLLFLISYALLFAIKLNACEGPYKNKSITAEQLESILGRRISLDGRQYWVHRVRYPGVRPDRIRLYPKR